MSAKLTADSGELYDIYGRPVQIVAKSETLLFFGGKRARQTISRNTLKKRGKARSGGEWFFLERGAAFAHAARAREKERKREAEREIARISTMAEQALAELDDSVTSRLRRLKAEMAAAHPDRGGTSEAFIKARQRYVDAKRIAGVR